MGYAFSSIFRVVESSQLVAKIAAYMFSISRLHCLAFLYRWRLLNKISLDWPLTLTTQPSTLKLSDNPDILTDFYQLQLCCFLSNKHCLLRSSLLLNLRTIILIIDLIKTDRHTPQLFIVFGLPFGSSVFSKWFISSINS